MEIERKIIGRGFGFPIAPSSDGRLQFQGGAEKVDQSLWLILSTAPGERVMLPDYGCAIHDLVFEANTVLLRSQIQAHVRAALLRWEPRINLLDVRVDTDSANNNRILIHIDYQIRANNSIYNLVYPFFIKEGAG